MALYQNFTTSQNGIITIPGPIMGTHSNNTIANIYTTNGNVGIGTVGPTERFHVSGNIKSTGTGIFGSNSILTIEDQTTFTRFACNETRFWDHQSSDILYINSPGVGVFKSPSYAFEVNGSRLNLHNAAGANGGQNLFEGVNNESIRAQIVISSSYSDLVIASSQANDNHGSTLTFASYNPTNKADYRKWVINQGNWGARVHMLEFGYNPNNEINPHGAIGDTYTTMTLDGTNKRLGLGTRSPSYQFTLTGSIGMDNSQTLLAKNAAGTYETFLWPRFSDNIMYLNYGSAGFHIRNNASTSAMFLNNSTNVGIGTTAPGYKLDVNGTVNASSLRVNGVSNCHIPTGGIIMWSGSTASIPTGWAICDGANGTPDLRNRFIIGAGNSYAVGAVGGATTNTLSTANLPPHSHSGTTDYMNQNWSHNHQIPMGDKDDLNCTHAGGQNALADGPGTYWTGSYTASTDTNHQHTFTTNNGPGSSSAFSIMPPYYALAFIMKL